jgi:hypothetical protein
MSDEELSSEGEHRTQVERDHKVSKFNVEYPSPNCNTDHPCAQKSTEYVKSEVEHRLPKTENEQIAL